MLIGAPTGGGNTALDGDEASRLIRDSPMGEVRALVDSI
jgi:hypothetical protein